MASVPALRSVRERRHLTQSSLASIASVSEASIRKWETGRGEPSPRSLLKLADALGVSVEQLTGQAPVQPLAIENARLSLRRGADCPGVVALLDNEALRASLGITDGEATLLRDGVCGPIGPETEDEAVQLLQAVRYMLARRGSQA